MSRHLCLHCRSLTPTTGTPNEVEGYFVTDYAIEAAGAHMRPPNECLDEWLEKRGKRAGLCPHCGMVTVTGTPEEE